MEGKLNSPDIQLARMKADRKQHIQVFVRVRPVNSQERTKNPFLVLDCPGNREVVVKERSSINSKTFTFDKVFGPKSKQIEVYRSVVQPLLEEVLLGYNCTVFAYGQTGTGKTFTMEGERTPDPDMPWEHDPLSGIIPRALSQLFEELRLQEAEFTVRVSLLELYNEELFDLLSPNEELKLKTLRLFEDSNRKGSVIIQGLEEVTVNNKHEVYKILEQGTIRRHTASTQMNASSSRSHTIFTVTVHIKESNVEGEELVKIGKLNLVDLAGSENIGRSGAINKHAREAGSINQSLLTLGRVITALVEKTPHIPYRESKLTRLLQDSLGGRTKTSIIATVSPSVVNMEETLSTLDYAHRAKDITNRPEVNQKMTKRAVLKEYTEEIERLRRDLNACREKNGVFLDKDNYAQMLSELEFQRQEINDKVVLTRALEETIQKKDESYAALQGELEETQDDLVACNEVLKQTTQTLEETRSELNFIRSERDQKSYLVEHHVQTERELTAQATKLLSTTDDATANLEKLYRKLDRKKIAEQRNLEAGRQFEADVTMGLEDMCQSIEDFRQEHSSFCGNQRLMLESFRTEEEDKINDFKKKIDCLINSVSTLKLREHVNTMVLSTRKWDLENIDYLGQVKQLGLSKAENFRTLSTSKLNNVIQAVTNLHANSEEVLKQFYEKTKDQLTFVETFVSNRLATLHTFQDLYLVKFKAQNLKNIELQGVIQKQQELLKSNATTFNSRLEALRKDYEEFHFGMASASNQLSNCIIDSMKESQSMFDLVKANGAVSQMKTNELKENMQKSVKAVEVDIVKTAFEVKPMYRNVIENTDAVCKRIQRYISSEVMRLTNSHKYQFQRFHEQDKKMADTNMELGRLEERLFKHINAEMNAFGKKIDEFHTLDERMIEELHGNLGDHCTQVSTWSENVAEQTENQMKKVADFWNSTYVVDGPTGCTPQRKAYNYPRLLSATSPHERIICRFLDRMKQSGGSTESDVNKNEVF